MQLFAKAISKVNVFAMWVCGGLIFFAGFIVTIDVLLRSFANYSIQWVFPLNGYISAIVALLAGGYALLDERHVKVDIFYNRFLPRTRGIVDICTSVLTYLICFVFIWFGGSLCYDSYLSGATTAGVLDMPSYIPQLLIPLGGLLLGLQALVGTYRDIKIALGIKPADKEV